MSNHIKPIGFIGVGLMGNSLVKRLIKKEFTINIYDKNKDNLKDLMNKKRIFLSTSPAKLSQDCDVIFICVDNTKSVADVVFQDSGIIKNASKNTDFNPKGYTSQILKDLTMVSELGDKKNIPLPMSNLTKQLFTILSEKSNENLDGTSIIKLFNKDDKF